LISSPLEKDQEKFLSTTSLLTGWLDLPETYVKDMITQIAKMLSRDPTKRPTTSEIIRSEFYSNLIKV